jgi:hypothetical protein
VERRAVELEAATAPAWPWEGHRMTDPERVLAAAAEVLQRRADHLASVNRLTEAKAECERRRLTILAFAEPRAAKTADALAAAEAAFRALLEGGG